MKAETKHTPGPWKVGKQRPIESLTIGGGCIIVVSEEAIQPNDASLIAAAPDLLQTCKEELDALEIWIRHETVRGDVLEGMLISRQKITAAISKAKGESV